MFDSLVDEPRLVAWWTEAKGGPEPLPLLADMRRALSARYGEQFDSIGFNLYRDADDSVAWHGDRHRHNVVNPVIAIVSVGAARALRIRPAAAAHGTRVGPRARRPVRDGRRVPARLGALRTQAPARQRAAPVDHLQVRNR